jgi:hypothetical protein
VLWKQLNSESDELENESADLNEQAAEREQVDMSQRKSLPVRIDSSFF